MKRGTRNSQKGRGILPNERRRQLCRKHSLSLIDRRGKWFYQQTRNSAVEAQDEPQEGD